MEQTDNMDKTEDEIWIKQDERKKAPDIRKDVILFYCKLGTYVFFNFSLICLKVLIDSTAALKYN